MDSGSRPGPGPGTGCAAASGARGWLVRAGRPGELLVHLAGKLTRGPAARSWVWPADWRSRPKGTGAPISAELGCSPVPSGADSSARPAEADLTARDPTAARPAGSASAGSRPAAAMPAAAGPSVRAVPVAYDRLSGRDRESMPRAVVPMQIPGASRRAEHVRPILDHASCDPPLRADRPRQCAFRDVPGGAISLPDSTSVRHSATGADPPFH